jgi:hypothetical protein
MNATLTPLQFAQIRLKVTDWSPPAEAIRDQLNALPTPNPTPQAQFPAPLYESELLGLLTPASIAKFRDHVNFGLVKADIARGNRTGVQLWAHIFAATLPGGFLTPAEVAAIETYCARTVPDPAWSPTVAWTRAAFGRPLTADDVRLARPGGG